MTYIKEIKEVINNLDGSKMKGLADKITKAYNVLICGNGGSAADSQHLAAELVARFEKERVAINAKALSTDTSVLTAIGNDYGFDNIFSRQVEAYGYSNSLLIVFSTSGNSQNCINAILKAKELGVETFAFLGKDGGKIKDIVDDYVIIPSNRTSHIQECHMILYHMLCEEIESLLK